MSSFPLPTGVCRSVCRPQRAIPRIVRKSDVVRFARAAVRNGEDPCDVASAVARAVDCQPCASQLADVVEGRDNLRDSWRAVRAALAVLLEIMGLSLLAEGMRDPELPEIDPDDLPGDSWWRSFWRRWVPFIRAGRFLVGVYELIQALYAYDKALAAFLASLADYLACLEGATSDD